MSSRYIVYFEIIILIHEGILLSLTYTSESPSFLFKKVNFMNFMVWNFFQFTPAKRPARPVRAFRTGILWDCETMV